MMVGKPAMISLPNESWILTRIFEMYFVVIFFHCVIEVVWEWLGRWLRSWHWRYPIFWQSYWLCDEQDQQVVVAHGRVLQDIQCTPATHRGESPDHDVFLLLLCETAGGPIDRGQDNVRYHNGLEQIGRNNCCPQIVPFDSILLFNVQVNVL